jgi:hypothetical protein
VHDEKPMNNTTVHARGGKTRVRTGSPAAVGSDGLLLARVSSSHGRRRGQEAERDSKDSCGRGDAGDQARCAPLYSYYCWVRPHLPSLSCPCFSPPSRRRGAHAPEPEHGKKMLATHARLVRWRREESGGERYVPE